MRQLNWTVGVAYALPTQALATIQRVVNVNTRVMQDPAPVIGVGKLGDSSINISVKPWVAISDYVPAQAELYQAIVEAFGTDHIQIPFPQREIRMLNAS
jgi:small conductance mechanosensitive channel